MRWSEVLRRICPYRNSRLGYEGKSVDDGPLATYFDCQACDVRWVVEMDERDPRPDGPMIVPTRLSTWESTVAL